MKKMLYIISISMCILAVTMVGCNDMSNIASANDHDFLNQIQNMGPRDNYIRLLIIPTLNKPIIFSLQKYDDKYIHQTFIFDDKTHQIATNWNRTVDETVWSNYIIKFQ